MLRWLFLAVTWSASFSALAGTFSTDFNSGLPVGIKLYGNAAFSSSGGTTNSSGVSTGCVKLTLAQGSQASSAFLDDLDAGAEVGSFSATFNLLAGGGTATPADGFSFNFANNLSTSIGEEGVGSGLIISFDTYDNGGGDDAPSIDIRWNGSTVSGGHFHFGNTSFLAPNKWVPVSMQLHTDGTFDLSYNSTQICTALPTPYRPTSGRFAWGARTGGYTENCWVDDVHIVTTPLSNPYSGAPPPGAIGGGVWIAQGGAPIWNGDAGVANGQVAGAINAVAVHPTDPNIVWIGAVNGGIWRTYNATAANPTWVPLTDFQPSLSITSIDLDPTDPTHNTLLAGIGNVSSYAVGGRQFGLLRSTNGGNTWTYIDGGGILTSKQVFGVIARGNTLLAAVRRTQDGALGSLGLYRSTDFGSNFVQVSSATVQPSSLPYGGARFLIADQNNPSVLYIAFTGQNGSVYRSSDTGATWTKISDADMDTLAGCGSEFIRISACLGSYVCVIFEDCNNSQYTHAFWSSDGGNAWIDVGLAISSETGNPSVKGGGAALIDPTNPQVFYVGGEWTMRCDLSQPPGSQWARLAFGIANFPPNSGTLGGSWPHEDARGMTFDSNGDLMYVEDGGIYRRTNPRSSFGSWYSMNGDLQVGEIHNIAYDPVFHVCVAGTQDNGTQRQIFGDQPLWSVITCCDGGDVAIDSTSVPGASIVYTSTQGGGNFVRQTYYTNYPSATNYYPPLTVTNGATFSGQFVTPTRVNVINPHRILFGAFNGVYESFDQGNTVSAIAPSVIANGLVYGGVSGGISNADVIYAAATTGVFVRSNSAGLLAATAQPFPPGAASDVAAMPNDWRTVFAASVDKGTIYMSTNAGATWGNITGNFSGWPRCLRVGAGPQGAALLLGADNGVFASSVQNIGLWNRVGTNLPNTLVFSLDYSSSADVLVAGTIGRGAWLIHNAGAQLFGPQPPLIYPQPQDQTILSGASARFDATVGGTPPFVYQWYLNGSPITGATNATLMVSLANERDVGKYSFFVGNGYGSAVSTNATLTIIPSTSIGTLQPPANLISWWPADGDARDRIGGNHGKVQTGSGFAPGKVGQAFAFNGVNGYIRVTGSSLLSGPRTIEGWVYPNSHTGSALPILTGGAPGTADFLNIAGSTACGTVNELFIDHWGTSCYDSHLTVAPNGWSHVAITYDGSTIRFYVNGIAGTPVTAPLYDYNINTLTIGGNTIGGSSTAPSFNGYIDDLRIYNRALTATEIQAIYSAGTNGLAVPSAPYFVGPYSINSGKFALAAVVRSSQIYRLQSSTNLGLGNWQTITNFIGGLTLSRFTNLTALDRVFYRMVSP